MMEMVIVWGIVPLLLLLLCYGFGLAFSLIIRKPLSSTITTALGFLLMGIIGSLTTISTATAPFTAIVFGAIALGGLMVSVIRFRSYIRLDRLSSMAGLITYVGFSLPVLAYGKPGWAGWIKLDDNSTFLAVTDRLMNVGRTVPSPLVSTYDRVLQTIFAGGSGHFSYPVGTFIPFGVITKLTRVEKAWFYQPYMSFAAALVAMLFVVILRSHLSNRYLILAFSSVSAMASTIYSYVMWGGVKEIVIVIPIALLAITAFAAVQTLGRRESLIYAVISFLGILVIGGTAGIGYAAPIILAALLVYLWDRNRRYFQTAFGLIVGLAVAGILVLKYGSKSLVNLFIPIIGDTGNLSKPLNIAQIFGIWPSQDFRADPVYRPLTIFLILMAFFLVLLGFYFCILQKKWVLPSVIAGCIAVVTTADIWGGIWLTGKAIAVTSPFIILMASMGAVEAYDYLVRSGKPRIQGLDLRFLVMGCAVLVGAGVVMSDVFTYKNVWFAQFPQLDELRTIGKLYAGQGPTLMTEYSVYGSRYFLRDLQAEAVSELRVHLIPTRDGTQVPKGFAADIDLFDPSTINYYNLLVLRKAPNASRPPVNYSLVWSGEHYEVWKKQPNIDVVKTLPLGTVFYPSAVPACSAVDKFLAQRTKSEKIYMAPRNKVYLVDFSVGDLPSKWLPMATYTGGIHYAGSGGFNRNFAVDTTGNYDMWLAGSYPGRLRVLIDGKLAYSGHSVFESNLYLTNPLISVTLANGAHVLTVLYDSPLLMPGSDSASEFGPIYFSSQTAGGVRVKQVSISKIPELCTQNLDWLAITK